MEGGLRHFSHCFVDVAMTKAKKLALLGPTFVALHQAVNSCGSTNNSRRRRRSSTAATSAPSYPFAGDGISLIEDAAFTRKIRTETARALKIEDANSKPMRAQDRTVAAR
jgi:hypothetical protein